MAPLPEPVAAPCAHPGALLDGAPWVVVAARLGDELLVCGQKHAAAVAAYDGVREAVE